MGRDKYIPTFTDLTDWNIKVYQNTGGTRSKTIVSKQNDETEYFFKGSKVIPETKEIRYPLEFWSEIASSKIGQALGFRMLDYNIGYNSNGIQKLGCLSKSMIDNSANELTEGVTYLLGKNPNYNPARDKRMYTFQFIEETLKHFRLDNLITDLIYTIVLDAIISNSDRHQENWGVITDFKHFEREVDEAIATEKNDKISNFFLSLAKGAKKWVDAQMSDIEKVNPKRALKLKTDMNENSFAPIYDSGCCLGREFDEVKVDKLIRDDQQFNAYIKRGKSEIHWEGVKLNHFELLKKIANTYKPNLKKAIERVQHHYKQDLIEDIINNLDINLPDELEDNRLSDNRKKLMIKILTLRCNKLFQLV